MARFPAWAAALCFLALVSASLAEPGAARCADAAGSDSSGGTEDDAVCALQQGALKKDTPPGKPVPTAVQVDAHRHTLLDASTRAESANAHAEKAQVTKKVNASQHSGGVFPWDSSSDPPVEQGGFGVMDGEALDYAMKYLDNLPSKSSFDEQVGYTGLPLTIAFLNDQKTPFTWDSMEEMDGHIFDEPEIGSTIHPGEIATVQMYAASDGLKGRCRVHDSWGNYLSTAFQSYRIGSFSCDRLRVRAMRTYKWDDPAGLMCTTNEAGIFRRNDYEVIVSLKRAE